MVQRFAWLVAVTAVALSAIIVFGTVAAAASPASGEKTHGQSTLEPVYDDTTGNVDYIMTPNKAPFPVNSNPKSWAPFYIPVYPVSAAASVGTLQCTHTQIVAGKPELDDNCPDHGPEVAAGAAAAFPNVYGPLGVDGKALGVLGHDHLLAPPGSGGDFNVAWQPILVLFTNTAAANNPKNHLTTLAQINALVKSGDVMEEGPLPTFHCEVVPEIVYTNSTPVTPLTPP
jgi:hypothetical protein